MSKLILRMGLLLLYDKPGTRKLYNYWDNCFKTKYKNISLQMRLITKVNLICLLVKEILMAV